MKPRIVLGGTFDPLHRGHLAAAEAVARCFGEPVHLLLAAHPPHRPPPAASPADRLAMLRAAQSERPWLAVDDRELSRPGPGYTVDSLSELRAELGPHRPIVFMLGQDAFSAFDRWRDWRRILGLSHLLVLARPGAETALPEALGAELTRREARSPEELLDSPSGRILRFPLEPMPVSASEVRARLERGESVESLLTPEVLAEIERRGLYRAPS
ncbi:MAG: hypothetical protein KatS3mg125_2030 [Lysobacterales bacterium]|nr:MAG: hypothetical protein KatS3mg125_2030 [Xanthomonadales bacterium]